MKILKSVKNNNDLKNVPVALIRVINKIFLGNVDSLEKAYDEYNKLLNRYDVRNLSTPKRTVYESDANNMRRFFNNLE